MKIKNVSSHRYVLPGKPSGKEKPGQKPASLILAPGHSLEVDENSPKVIQKLHENYPEHFVVLGDAPAKKAEVPAKKEPAPAAKK